MPTSRLRDSEAVLGRSDIHKVDPRSIKVEPGHNARDFALEENRTHIDTLKESILSIGLQLPLLIRWESSTGSIYLVDGECRLRAIMELIAEGHEIVSVHAIQVQANNEIDRITQMAVSNTGKAFTQWEAGTIYRRLARFGVDTKTIAARCNVTVHYVTMAIELADAPQEVKQQLSEGLVTPAAARAAVRDHGANAAAVIEAEVKSAGGKPVRREKAVNKSVKISLSLLAAAKKVLASVTDEEWSMDDKWINIDREAINALHIAVNG